MTSSHRRSLVSIKFRSVGKGTTTLRSDMPLLSQCSVASGTISGTVSRDEGEASHVEFRLVLRVRLELLP